MALSEASTTSNPGQNHNGEIQEIDVSRRFDVVSDASDHYYINNASNNSKKNGTDCFTNFSSGVHKKIMQEWKILEKHLPDAIFVRVYENRIDLLRAVIIGAAGTPYHDGLYFFDIGFPSDYPRRPPFVHYRSFGLRINPNLYANGRVCLSLLNTWTGKKSEKWSPNESTLLQVLLSIQALVLNEKPYFNEPGIGMWPGRLIWEKKSNAYNEDVFVLSCKTMIYLLRRPPKNFEGFVAGHFRQRAQVILSACDAYMQGRVRVGYYAYSNDMSSSSSSNIGVSQKFKGLMAKLYPELVADFVRNAPSLGTFVEQLKVEKKNTVVVIKKKSGIAWVLKKLKKVFGLKKKKKKKSGNSTVKKNTSSS